MSSYLLFAQENRQALKEAHPELTHQEHMAKMASMWKEADHKVYEERANSLMESFRSQMGDYIKTKGASVSDLVDSAEVPATAPSTPQTKEKKIKSDETVEAPSSPLVATPKKSPSKPAETVEVVETPAMSPKKVLGALNATADPEVGDKKKKKKTKNRESDAELTANEAAPASPAKALDQVHTEIEPKPKKVKKTKDMLSSQHVAA